MALTPQQLKTAFYNVLYSDSAGSAVRAALGAGASSVIDRTAIGAGVTSLPARPFVSLSWGDGGGPRNRGVKTFYPIWWLTDDDSYKWKRLEALVDLIHAAYAEDSIAMAYLDFLPVRELTNRALGGMPEKSVLFTLRTRG